MQLERALRLLLAGYCMFLGLLKFVNGYSDEYTMPLGAFYVFAVLECALGVLLFAATRLRVTLSLLVLFFFSAIVFSLVHDGDYG
ncbi:MAG: hypothetical protein ACE5F1_08450 [Planctomycetota bacterium]